MASSFHSSSAGVPHKITKAKTKVKPILKKFSSSEKNSLDLDRPWEEQLHAWGGGLESTSSNGGHSVAFSAEEVVGAGNGGRKYHVRSTSQTSNGSNTRSGFVHPFQQTPRTATPPLSYANSLASFDNTRDYSPTITENEDDEQGAYAYAHRVNGGNGSGNGSISTSNHGSSNHSNGNGSSSTNSNTHSQSHHSHHHHPHVSQSSLRRPSIASQRTGSFPESTTPAPPLRVSTSRSNTGASSRLGPGKLATSHSDLQLSLESPIESINGHPPAPLASPTSSVSVANMSPIRSSLEHAGFPRLRSRSELDTGSRADNIREARRKFEERERAKNEKYAREQIKKRERRDTREAARVEKEAAQWKKESGRPSMSRKSTPTNLSTASTPGVGTPSGSGAGVLGSGDSSKHDVSSSLFGLGTLAAITSNKETRCAKQQSAKDADPQKQMDFVSRKYDSVPVQAPPAFVAGVVDGPVSPDRDRRGSSTKKRTQGYWHGFILWLRTKLLRFGGR